MWRALSCFLFTFLVWLAITWSLAPLCLGIGLAASVLVAAALRDIELQDAPLLLLPVRLFFALAYLPVLFAYVVQANFDVAYRVLHPKLPIRPGILRVRTTLKSAAGRVLLANSITLTPGTLSVDVVGDVLYIHFILVPDPRDEAEPRRMLARFERYIARIFE